MSNRIKNLAAGAIILVFFYFTITFFATLLIDSACKEAGGKPIFNEWYGWRVALKECVSLSIPNS